MARRFEERGKDVNMKDRSSTNGIENPVPGYQIASLQGDEIAKRVYAVVCAGSCYACFIIFQFVQLIGFLVIFQRCCNDTRLSLSDFGPKVP